MSHELPILPRRFPWPLVIALALALIVSLRWLLLRFEMPIKLGAFGCPLYRLTGFYCGGCGGTRAFFAFLKGDLALSWRMNPVFLTGLVLGGFYGSLAIMDRFGGGRPRGLGWAKITTAGGLWLLAAILIFAVLRNIPQWPFTILAPP